MKKLSESSQPAKPTNASGSRRKPKGNIIITEGDDFFRKPLSSAHAKQMAKLAAMPDSEIDYSDIPPLTDAQLASAVRLRDARPVTAVRLDPDVLAWLKEFGPGHTSRINQILRQVMLSSRAAPNR